MVKFSSWRDYRNNDFHSAELERMVTGGQDGITNYRASVAKSILTIVPVLQSLIKAHAQTIVNEQNLWRGIIAERVVADRLINELVTLLSLEFIDRHNHISIDMLTVEIAKEWLALELSEIDSDAVENKIESKA